MEGKGAKLFINLACLPSIFYCKKIWKGGFCHTVKHVRYIVFSEIMLFKIMYEISNSFSNFKK